MAPSRHLEGEMKLNHWRNRLAVPLANLALKIATPEYRQFVEGVIKYGMNAAAENVIKGRPVPADWRWLRAKP